MLFRIIFLLLYLEYLVFASGPHPNTYTNIAEEDGTPDIYPYKIKFNNGTITDNLDSTASHDISGYADGVYLRLDATNDPVTADLDLDGKLYNEGQVLYNGDEQRDFSVLPVQRTWTQSATIISPINSDNSPKATLFAEVFLMKVAGTYYCFWEYYDSGPPFDWKIGMAHSTDLSSTWTVVEPILEPSGDAGEPDETGVADPTVLYIPWAEYKWHMWFDMYDGTADWYIGHAYTNDPTGVWTKQDLDANNVTDIVIGGDITSFDGYNSDEPAHAPEAYLYGGSVRIIYAARGTGHTGYDLMLAMSNDSQGLGYSFSNWGPVTDDTTTAWAESTRLGSVYNHQGFLYSNLRDTNATGDTKDGWVVSSDGGISWQQVGESAFRIQSLMLEDNILYAAVPYDNFLYTMNLDSLSGQVDQADNIVDTNISIPLIGSVKNNYYIDGESIYDFLLDGDELKLLPSAGGDIICAGDSDVADDEDGIDFFVKRMADEGDSFFKIGIDEFGQLFFTSSSFGGFSTFFDANGTLQLNNLASGGVSLFASSTSGENQSFAQYGYITAAAAAKFTKFTIDDTDDYLHLERQDANVLGFKIEMPLDLVENSITNAGDISLDSLSSDGSTIVINSGQENTITTTDGTDIVIALGGNAGDDFNVDGVLKVSGDTVSAGIGIDPVITASLSLERTYSGSLGTGVLRGLEDNVIIGAALPADQVIAASTKVIAAHTSGTSLLGLGYLGGFAVEANGGTTTFGGGVAGQVFAEAGFTGTVTNARALWGLITARDATFTDARLIYSQAATKDTGTITDLYGGYFDQQTVGTNNWTLFSAGGIIDFNAGTAAINVVTIDGAPGQSGSLLRLRDSAENNFISSGDGLTGSEFRGNVQGVDIDLAWNGNTITDLLKVDAGLDILESNGGSKINETRYTGVDTILVKDHIVWGDTDGGSFTLTLPDGVGGREHTVTNSGSSGNALTLASDGSDTIAGGASINLYDDETADIKFDSTDNEWRA